MALRLITTRTKCHLVLNSKNFRTCLDMSKINSQELLRNLSVWMNQAPKGFEKFQRDRKRGAKNESSKETKSRDPPPASSTPPPSKSAGPQEKKEFTFKFDFPSSGGSGGKKSGPGGETNQEELLKRAGIALVAILGMYYLHVQVNYVKLTSNHKNFINELYLRSLNLYEN